MNNTNAEQIREKRSRLFSWVIFFILLSVSGFVAWQAMSTMQQQWTQDGGVLRVTQLNVGQGDGLLVQTPQGNDILIDAGRDRRILSEIGTVLQPWNTTIEYVIATHEDADHIGGFPFIAQQYQINEWIVSGRTKETTVTKELHAAQEREGVMHVATAGESIAIEDGVSLEILSPDQDVPAHEDINDDSVVAILHYHDFALALTGDAGITSENEIMKRHEPIDVDILKAGHHGSKTSTSPEFLQWLDPEIVLISAGQDNDYGHPHYRVLHDIEQYGAWIFRTDKDGRITCETEGLPGDVQCSRQYE